MTKSRCIRSACIYIRSMNIGKGLTYEIIRRGRRLAILRVSCAVLESVLIVSSWQQGSACIANICRIGEPVGLLGHNQRLRATTISALESARDDATSLVMRCGICNQRKTMPRGAPLVNKCHAAFSEGCKGFEGPSGVMQ